MRWPPRSTGRPLRDGGGASAGRPARVTGEGRGTLPQTRRENMPPNSAARQCRQEVTLQNLRSEEHTSELQSRGHLVCRLLLEKKNRTQYYIYKYQSL